MSRWRLLQRRARLLDDIRFAEDVVPDGLTTARNRLAKNAQALGIAWLPKWLLVLFDGGIRGIHGYQQFGGMSIFGGNIWRWLGAISLGCAILYYPLRQSSLLFGAILGPSVALICFATGATYYGLRALLGSATWARLLSAAVAGLVALGGPVLALATLGPEPLKYGRLPIIGGLSLALGAAFECIDLIMSARSRKWFQDHIT